MRVPYCSIDPEPAVSDDYLHPRLLGTSGGLYEARRAARMNDDVISDLVHGPLKDANTPGQNSDTRVSISSIVFSL